MFITILTLIICIVVTEALTELLVESEFFKFLRDFFDKRATHNRVFEFFSDLLLCGYCTSVWVAFFVMLLYVSSGSVILSVWIDWFLLWLFFHRGSNFVHYIGNTLR